MQEIKITHVEAVPGTKPEKVTKPRPAFEQPIFYVAEDGTKYESSVRLQKKGELAPYIEGLAQDAAKGCITAKVQGTALICTQRSFSLR